MEGIVIVKSTTNNRTLSNTGAYHSCTLLLSERQIDLNLAMTRAQAMFYGAIPGFMSSDAVFKPSIEATAAA